MSADLFADMSPAIRSLATLTLPIRRICFWIVWHWGWLTGRIKPVSGYRPLFSKYLGTSKSQLNRLERRFSFAHSFSTFELATFLGRPLSGLIRDLRYVDIENVEAMESISREERSVILAPIHMGSNVFVMAVLIYRFFRGRRILILRKNPREIEGLIYDRLTEIGSEVRFMFVDDKASYVEALRFARRRAVIICFCDLPPHFGSPERVELLGRPARMAMGIETLARAVDAPIVPFATFSQLNREQVIVRKPFEVGGNSAGHRLSAARRIADHVTQSIREAPDQWELWWLLDCYLDELAEHKTDHAPSAHHRSDHPYALAESGEA